MAAFQGVILDIDGTLVDSNDAHAESWVTALTEHSYQIEFDLVRRLIGMGGDNLLPETAHVEKESVKGKALAKRYLEVFKEQHLSTLQAMPGARELVEHMLKKGLKIVIGSSSEADVLDTLLEIAGVQDLLDQRVSSKEVQASKPDPDIILAALNKLGLPHEHAVMIGDTPYDVLAARKAGVQTIALRCGGWSDADLQDALAIYEDPADLLAHYAESPLG